MIKLRDRYILDVALERYGSEMKVMPKIHLYIKGVGCPLCNIDHFVYNVFCESSVCVMGSTE